MQKEPKLYILTHLLPYLLPLSVIFVAVSPLPSNQAVSYSMLQLSIMWLTLFSDLFILELSIVLVLGLLYISGTGFKIYSAVETGNVSRLVLVTPLPHRICDTLQALILC